LGNRGNGVSEYWSNEQIFNNPIPQYSNTPTLQNASIFSNTFESENVETGILRLI
jgi:hypothetical protein